MIKPTLTNAQFSAKINAADFATLLTAISSAAVIEMPTGKTLEDVKNLNLNVLPVAQPDGTVAILNAGLRA